MTTPNDRRYLGDPERYPDPYEPILEPPDEPPPPEPRRRLITPLRVMLGLAVLGSIAVVGYGLLARDETQLPMMTAGVFVSGLTFVLLALAGAWAAYSRARDGSAGSALVYAFLGGIAALLAAAFFATAIVLLLTLGKVSTA